MPGSKPPQALKQGLYSRQPDAGLVAHYSIVTFLEAVAITVNPKVFLASWMPTEPTPPAPPIIRIVLPLSFSLLNCNQSKNISKAVREVSGMAAACSMLMFFGANPIGSSKLFNPKSCFFTGGTQLAVGGQCCGRSVQLMFSGGMLFTDKGKSAAEIKPIDPCSALKNLFIIKVSYTRHQSCRNLRLAQQQGLVFLPAILFPAPGQMFTVVGRHLPHTCY